MKFSFSKVLLFSFIGLIVIAGLAFYAGVLTKKSLEDIESADNKGSFSFETTTKELTESNGKDPSQPHIEVEFAKDEWVTSWRGLL